MNKAIHLAALATLTFGVPLALQPVFSAAYQSSDDWVHCSQETPCYNGQIPSYDNPDCWPGAIYCDRPENVKGHGHGHGGKRNV